MDSARARRTSVSSSSSIGETSCVPRIPFAPPVAGSTCLPATAERVRLATAGLKRMQWPRRPASAHGKAQPRQPHAWSGRRDLNSRPPAPQSGGGAAKLLNHKGIFSGNARRPPCGPQFEAYYHALPLSYYCVSLEESASAPRSAPPPAGSRAGQPCRALTSAINAWNSRGPHSGA